MCFEPCTGASLYFLNLTGLDLIEPRQHYIYASIYFISFSFTNRLKKKISATDTRNIHVNNNVVHRSSELEKSCSCNSSKSSSGFVIFFIGKKTTAGFHGGQPFIVVSLNKPEVQCSQQKQCQDVSIQPVELLQLYELDNLLRGSSKNLLTSS